MSRRNLLTHVAGAHGDNPSGAEAGAGLTPIKQLSARGPAGTITRSIDELAARAAVAEAAAARYANAEAVLEIDPNLIDSSFAQDRMAAFDPEGADAEFIASIRDQGQMVPALLRPNPKAAGRYQPAYGRRRIAAAAFLGRKVRAVVRALADEDLVIAQGQENEARNGLTFVEKCRFAATLEAQGFKRKVVEAALCAAQPHVSAMLQIIEKIPGPVIDWIGPAPEIGRPRWVRLARLSDLPGSRSSMAKVVADEPIPGGINLSGERFNAILAAVTEHAGIPSASTPWSLPGQKRPYGALDVTPRRVILTIDRAANPAFADALLERVDAIRRELESATAPATPSKKG